MYFIHDLFLNKLRINNITQKSKQVQITNLSSDGKNTKTLARCRNEKNKTKFLLTRFCEEDDSSTENNHIARMQSQKVETLTNTIFEIFEALSSVLVKKLQL